MLKFLAYIKKMDKSNLLATTFSQNWNKGTNKTILHKVCSFHWTLLQKLKTGNLSEFKKMQTHQCHHTIANNAIQDNI